MSSRRRIGIVGYGHLGKFLANAILEHPELELAFVWNRSSEVFSDSTIPKGLVIHKLADAPTRDPDLIVEVAHPSITQQYGGMFLGTCDYLIGSPTALADKELNNTLRDCALKSGHSMFVPSGALWGGEDIQKMADRGTLHSLTVTMKKHPSSFKLAGDLEKKNEEAKTKNEEETILYEGPVRDLCPLAPNNVNTMAAAAVAGHNLGFENAQGRLIADPKLEQWHVVEVYAEGPLINGNRFSVHTVRKNPANPGAVTGSATYGSFLSSLLRAKGKEPGVHLC